MRRVAGMGMLLLTGACTVAGPREAPRPEPVERVPGATGAEPAVRVGVVVDTPSLEIGGTAGVDLLDAEGRVRGRAPAGQTRVARRAGAGVEVEGGGEVVRVSTGLTLRPIDGGEVVVNGKRYRGDVLLRLSERGLTAVNIVEMETYLLGVVPLEIGGGRPPEELEAVKAQAVAARTYAVRHMGRRESLGFDIYGSTMDQVYGGADADDPVSARAVRETRGEIIVYEGEPIEAFYHSTCGGHTAALEEVWVGEPRPYLTAVSDARPGGGFYCESSNRFRWTESWTRSELVETLERGLSAHVGRDVDVATVRSMAVTGRTTSGRTEAVSIRTDAGDFRIRGDSIRWILRPEPNRILNSALIELHTEGSGEVTGLTVDGGGWGHGIGMCQIGAVARSREGQSYREILTTYYRGTRIARLYQ
ncbi:MAG: SpoIID/LytB domain-containing protein [Gemmatimonadetes bacterium]|nr:SpoIID/LytB domain-containing protein [Gemmatimonadota bacterium]